MSLLFSSLHADAVPAFAAATRQARQAFNPANSSTGNVEEESHFDEFGAFGYARAEEQTHPVIEQQHEAKSDDDEDCDEFSMMNAQLVRVLPTQKNSPGLPKVEQAPQPAKNQEPHQKASPKAVGTEQAVEAGGETGHNRAATDPLSSAALSRMRYYRKLIPAPKPQHTSPKSEPPKASDVPNAATANEQSRRFFPPSHSAAALFYQPSNRSLPITIPSRKPSPTSDGSHRFRADVHPRIAADSSFVLPAASFLPSALRKSFVPHGNDEREDIASAQGKKQNSAWKAVNVPNSDANQVEEFGFEFEMDM